MITDSAVTVLISHPGDGDLLALRSDPVGRSLIGVSCFVAGALLDVGFLAGSSIGSGVAVNQMIFFKIFKIFFSFFKFFFSSFLIFLKFLNFFKCFLIFFYIFF
jgi:hypothetical protein